MLKGFNKDGELKDVQVTDDGEVMVKMASGGGQTVQEVEIVNTSEKAVPVDLQNENIVIGNTSANAVPVDIQNASVQVGNTSSNAIPVNIINVEEVETTLNASVQTVGTTPTVIAVNKKVTEIDIANYSATAKLTATIGNLQYLIAENIAVSLPINKNISNFSIVSDESNTQIQVIIKGVE